MEFDSWYPAVLLHLRLVVQPTRCRLLSRTIRKHIMRCAQRIFRIVDPGSGDPGITSRLNLDQRAASTNGT